MVRIGTDRRQFGLLHASLPTTSHKTQARSFYSQSRVHPAVLVFELRACHLALQLCGRSMLSTQQRSRYVASFRMSDSSFPDKMRYASYVARAHYLERQQAWDIRRAACLSAGLLTRCTFFKDLLND